MQEFVLRVEFDVMLVVERMVSHLLESHEVILGQDLRTLYQSSQTVRCHVEVVRLVVVAGLLGVENGIAL